MISEDNVHYEQSYLLFFLLACREKQGRVYGCLGTCYEMLRQFPQAIFCHNKVESWLRGICVTDLVGRYIASCSNNQGCQVGIRLLKNFPILFIYFGGVECCNHGLMGLWYQVWYVFASLTAPRDGSQSRESEV